MSAEFGTHFFGQAALTAIRLATDVDARLPYIATCVAGIVRANPFCLCLFEITLTIVGLAFRTAH